MKAIKLLLSLVITVTMIGSSYAGKDKNKEPKKIDTTTITGKIVDKLTGEALTGVLVKINGTNVASYTDFEGNFSFNNIKQGSYDISVSYISYEDSILKDITADKLINTLKIELVNFKGYVLR